VGVLAHHFSSRAKNHFAIFEFESVGEYTHPTFSSGLAGHLSFFLSHHSFSFSRAISFAAYQRDRRQPCNRLSHGICGPRDVEL